jgi:hypothetical protein
LTLVRGRATLDADGLQSRLEGAVDARRAQMGEQRQGPIGHLTRWGLKAIVGAITTGVLAKVTAKPAHAGHTGTNVFHLGADNTASTTTTTKVTRSGPAAATAFVVENQNGGAIRGQGSGAGIGVRGDSNAFYGVYGRAPSGIAVGGFSSYGYGVWGESTQKAGVWGESSSDVGVRGESNQQAGVYGNSHNGPGVQGNSTNDYGVAGTSDASPGVHGQSIQSVGVHGTSASGIGVRGDSSARFGVLGTSDTDDGVRGVSKERAGVVGISDRERGVVGRGSNLGVSGSSPESVGVGGEGPRIGVLGRSHPSGGRGVLGLSMNGVAVGGVTTTGLAGRFQGNVQVDGNFVVSGKKSAAVPHPDGSHRLLYCLESPESWFEDFGRAELRGGRAAVRLDPDFAAVARTDGYHVFLTPEGDSQGLYVSRRNRTGFEVREQQRGKSSLAFSYRVVARRKDIEGGRLEKVTLAPPIEVDDLPSIELEEGPPVAAKGPPGPAEPSAPSPPPDIPRPSEIAELPG